MLHPKFIERRPKFWAGGFLFDAAARKVLIRLRKGSIFAWASRIRVSECLRACPAAPCSPFIAFAY